MTRSAAATIAINARTASLEANAEAEARRADDERAALQQVLKPLEAAATATHPKTRAARARLDAAARSAVETLIPGAMATLAASRRRAEAQSAFSWSATSGLSVAEDGQAALAATAGCVGKIDWASRSEKLDVLVQMGMTEPSASTPEGVPHPSDCASIMSLDFVAEPGGKVTSLEAVCPTIPGCALQGLAPASTSVEDTSLAQTCWKDILDWCDPAELQIDGKTEMECLSEAIDDVSWPCAIEVRRRAKLAKDAGRAQGPATAAPSGEQSGMSERRASLRGTAPGAGSGGGGRGLRAPGAGAF
jgi:hypothetical protein